MAEARDGGLKGLTVLELGAGTGLVAAAAHALGARVVATDHQPLILRLLRTCRDALEDRRDAFVVRRLDLGVAEDVAAAVEAEGPFDIVVAASTCYILPLASATARAVVASKATARLVVDPTPRGQRAFEEELGLSDAFRPVAVDATAIKIVDADGNARAIQEEATHVYDGAYAVGFERLGKRGCCVS